MSPSFASILIVLPPSTNLIVVDWVLPATFAGATKAKKRVLPVRRHVPEPLTGLPENVAVKAPLALNSISSLPLHEVVEPPGSGRVPGQLTDCFAVAIDVCRHRPIRTEELSGELLLPLVLQPIDVVTSSEPVSTKIEKMPWRMC